MLKLPNVRKLFLPDKGKIICDVDLSGADAQVVAWEAEDEDLKRAFKSGIDVHNKNGFDVFGSGYRPADPSPRKGTKRDELKAAVHGTNYAGGIRTISKDLGWTGEQVNAFQRSWFSLHPGIKEWHRTVERNLQTKRMVSNKFGYRIIYFDRPDNLLPKGLAWIPQSTIAGVTARAAINLSRAIPWAEILLQVHDSLVFQIPLHRHNNPFMDEIKRTLAVEVPYDGDPLIIPWGLALSEKSWGDIQKRKWEDI